jgi:FHA domain-containing protein
MRFAIVKNKNGQVPPQSSCDFLPPGGTIGRSVDNNLVLPDEERAISRLQAIVHISVDGGCRITNRGNVTNVQLNNIPLERGRQVELQDGDILGIDDYQIQVSSLQPASVPAPTTANSVNIEPVVTPNTVSVPNEIWDSLIQEFPPGEISPAPASYHDNHHPLLAEPRVELNPNDPLEQLTGNIDLQHLQTRPIDPATLFNSDTPFDQVHILADTTPSTLLAESHMPEPVPSMENHASAQELDPLALFGTSSAPAAVSDSLNGEDPLGLQLSGAIPSATPPLSLTPETPVRAAITQPEPPKVQPQTAPAKPRSRPGNRLGIDPIADSIDQPPSLPASDGETLEGPLLRALLQGLGLYDLQPAPHFDEQQLRQVGRLLSLFSQGTVALLSSRSILKRGVKAEMTMILNEANNPFKLLPSGKTVLMQMFGSKMPGFIPPEQSVRDALIDLQAHQLGMIAGIRAIIAAMLQSFNPELLEEAARQEGTVPRLALPSSRKGALWDYFVKSYRKTSGELEDDFHTLFGEAFLHAYAVEANQYKDSQIKPEAP